MSEELREEIKAAIRRHDPSAEELRSLSEDFEQLADRYENQEEIL